MKRTTRKDKARRAERCYDCGSDFPGHHTPLCEFTEETDVLDLPAVPGTQHVDRKHPAYKAMLSD